MGGISLHSPGRAARKLRLIGIGGWLAATIAAWFLGSREAFAAAGAIGLCTILAFVVIERRAIDDERESMRRFYGDSRVNVMNMTEKEYNKLSEIDKHAYDETAYDIWRNEAAYDADVRRVENLELVAAVILTLQLAYGAMLYDILAGLINANS